MRMPWPRNCTPGEGYSVRILASKSGTPTTSIGLSFVCVEAGTGFNTPSFPSATTQTVSTVGVDDAEAKTFTIDTSACGNGKFIFFQLSKTGTEWLYMWEGEMYQ
jgi:hypothetical protein